MALQIYAEAVKEFRAAIDEIALYIAFVSEANRLRPRVGAMVQMDDLDAHQKSAILAFVSQKDYHIEVGLNGLMVSLASAFEHFFRRLIRDAVVWINNSHDTFESLNRTLHYQNVLRSGNALATIVDPPVEITYDYENLCKNLGTCRKDGGKLVLNSEAFAVNISNVTPTRIDDCLARIGVTINWDSFAATQEIRRVTSETRTRDATNKLQKWLKEFIVTRNRIAHAGVGGIQVTETQLASDIDKFKVFGPGLASVVDATLSAMYKRK